VRLFVDRARAVQPRFTLTPQNAGAVAQVCRRLDGIPLAIELAAARSRALSVEQLAGRLDQRFRLLTGGSRTALPRQQTLQATVDWSYSLLGAPEQRLFALLSVFVGGFTLEAAEAVCAGDDLLAEEVLDLLTRLVDKSLVVAEETAEGTSRYRLLETLRQYGRERLVASGEATALHDRHAAYFVALAERADAEMRGPAQITWLTALEREHDNLRAALAWSLEQAEQHDEDAPTPAAELGLRLASALAWFWYWHQHIPEGAAWLDRALRQEAGAPAARRAKAVRGAGLLAWALDSFGRAQALLSQSVLLYRECGGGGELVVALCWLSLALMGSGQDEQSARSQEEALDLARAGGDPWFVAAALQSLCRWVLDTAAVQLAEQRARARAAIDESLRLFQALGDTMSAAGVQWLLGRLALYEGDYPRARNAFNTVLAVMRAVGSGELVAIILGDLAEVSRQEGDDADATRAFAETLAVYRDLGYDEDLMAGVLTRLGELALDQGAEAAAQNYAHESVSVTWSTLQAGRGDVRYIAGALELYGGIAAAQGDPRRALRLAGATAALREQTSRPLPPFDQAALTRRLAPARQALSAEEQAGAWREGQAMTLEQAIASALKDPAAV
jgi:tetratricopeptide (TPR) repeat protein